MRTSRASWLGTQQRRGELSDGYFSKRAPTGHDLQPGLGWGGDYRIKKGWRRRAGARERVGRRQGRPSPRRLDTCICMGNERNDQL